MPDIMTLKDLMVTGGGGIIGLLIVLDRLNLLPKKGSNGNGKTPMTKDSVKLEIAQHQISCTEKIRADLKEVTTELTNTMNMQLGEYTRSQQKVHGRLEELCELHKRKY